MSMEQIKATHLGWHVQMLYDAQYMGFIIRAFHPASAWIVQERVDHHDDAGTVSATIDRVCAEAIKASRANKLPQPPGRE